MRSLDIASVRWGLAVALCTLLMGAYLGIQFGKNEDQIWDSLKARGEASTYYHKKHHKPRQAANTGWNYLRRSHEHFQGLGGISIALILTISATWVKPLLKTFLALGVGIGGFTYPMFWYLVAYKSADVGAHAAKESLALMAQFGAGLYFVSLLATFAVVIIFAVWKDNRPAFLKMLEE